MKKTIKWELSKRKIEILKKGQLYFLVQYWHDKKPFKTYIAAFNMIGAENEFNELYGSKNAPCRIEAITPKKGDEQTKIVIYTHIIDSMENGNSNIDSFIIIGRKFNMSAKAVESLFYRVRREDAND